MWASHWYGAVHASTGFGAAAPDRVLVQRQEAISSQVLQVYREALPFYLLLARQALGVHPLSSALSSASPAAVDDACAVDAVASAAAVGGGGGAEQSIIDHGLSLPSAAASTVSASAAGGRNADVLVWIGDRLLPREYAAVSVFDSTVQVTCCGPAAAPLSLWTPHPFVKTIHLHSVT